MVETRGRRRVQKPVIPGGPHPLRGIGPACPRPTDRLNDQPSRFGAQFGPVGKPRRFDQGLWQSDAARLSDADEASPRGHAITW
jgi:hypothetical protein